MAISAQNRTNLIITRISANGDREIVECRLIECHRYRVKVGSIVVDVKPANDNKPISRPNLWVAVQLSDIGQNILCNLLATLILLACKIPS